MQQRPNKKLRILLLLAPIGVIVLLLTCGVLIAMPTLFPGPAPRPIIRGECLWVAEVRAFIDQDEDAQWDEGELPLSGVKFHLDDVLNKYKDVGGPSISDAQGSSTVTALLGGCPEVVFEMYAEAPQGYIHTTLRRIHVGGDKPKDPLFFGFKRTQP
jgi:hypothetical protein